jgi:hypothetical protein
MTDRSEETLELGPATRKQLESVVAQAAGGLLLVAIEAAGYTPDGNWSLSIERATLTRGAPPPSHPPENGPPSLNAVRVGMHDER